MESDSRKFSLLSFLILAGLIAYVFYLISTELANWLKFGGSNVMFGQPWTVIGGSLSVLVGLIIFIVLSLNTKALSFTDEVMGEAKKTTWPTAKETAASTVVVSIMVLVAALAFLLMDLVWQNLFEFLL